MNEFTKLPFVYCGDSIAINLKDIQMQTPEEQMKSWQANHYISVLVDGCDINIGKLSVCLLNRYVSSAKTRYQVHCDDKREEVSQLFDNPRDAVAEFLRIKRKLKLG